MAESKEHQFLKSELHRILKDFSGTGLLGVFEADRRKFDYSCRLERDFSRPLVAQICWGNVPGIHKDLEHLLIGSNAPVKLYILPDKQKARLRLDEALARYRVNPGTRPLLNGFRYLGLPYDFDADNDAARARVADDLKRQVCSDLLFGAIFGRLCAEDVTEFAQYMGPEGLKFALLNRISRQPLASILDVKTSLGINSSKNATREALVMLRATGLLYQNPHAWSWHPTVKGRFLLDLIRRLVFEAEARSTWSDELGMILRHLDMPEAQFAQLPVIEEGMRFEKIPMEGDVIDKAHELIESAMRARKEFGIDPLEGINRAAPVFYSDFDWHQRNHLVPCPPLHC